MDKTNTTTPATADPHEDNAPPEVAAIPSATDGIDFMTLLEPASDPSDQLRLERIIEQIDQMDRAFARIVRKHRTLRARIVARLGVPTSTGTVVKLTPRKRRGERR